LRVAGCEPRDAQRATLILHLKPMALELGISNSPPQRHV
jgi:hypothetical protein